MFDVLEHIEDEARALRIVNQKLKPGGRIALSVPAYMWLWGQQDIVNHHYRRYTVREVKWKLRGCRFYDRAHDLLQHVPVSTNSGCPPTCALRPSTTQRRGRLRLRPQLIQSGTAKLICGGTDFLEIP